MSPNILVIARRRYNKPATLARFLIETILSIFLFVIKSANHSNHALFVLFQPNNQAETAPEIVIAVTLQAKSTKTLA